MVLEQGGVAGRADVGGVVDVLQADRDAVQRAFPAPGRNLLLGGFRAGYRLFFQQQQGAVQHRVQAFHPCEERLGQLDGG